MNPDLSGDDGRGSARGSIWVFTPSRTDPRDLESILVQRHDLLKDSVERVRESALSANKHHLLFVGPRGCGKTHLITLIVSRIAADAEVSDRLRIAWLNEDETCTSLLELLLKVHSALAKRHPDEFRPDELSEAYERKPAEALDFVSRQLLASLGDRTLLIVTENLDALFEAMGKQGQQQLRAFIQENPRISVVATAQRLVDDLSDRASPFFGFFQTEHLKPLNVEEATSLLRNIAHVQGKADVVEFLATTRGRSRVRALHHLSGGNHRIYIVLSQFITRESMDSLIGPFMKMVDELTPYYQERLRWLPPLQRKIVEFLCSCEGTVPVKEIARRLFSTPQTISSQLQDLREKGYVESRQRGRESLYEVSEPLMRICVEVKENQNLQPLRLLVDFLRVWYDDGELNRRLGAMEPASAFRAYLEAALSKNKVEGSLRIRLMCEDLGIEFPRDLLTEVIEQSSEDIAENLLLAVQCSIDGNNREAIKCLSEVISSPKANAEVVVAALICRGICSRIDDEKAAIRDFTRAIDFPGASSEQVAKALFNRGIANAHQGDAEASMRDFTCVVELPDAPTEQVAKALVKRGSNWGQRGDAAAAITDYTRVIELAGAPRDQIVEALVKRGIALDRQGESMAAISDFNRAAEASESPPDKVARALLCRAIVHAKQGDFTAAIADSSQLIDMQDAPPDLVARALYMRAASSVLSENAAEAHVDFHRLMQQAEAPAKIRIEASVAQAMLHSIEGRWAEGFASLEAGFQLGARQKPPYFGSSTDLVGVVFGAGLGHEARCTKVVELLGIYARHQALPMLGDAVIQHIGGLFRAGRPWPSTDNLEQWALAWEQAAASVPDFRLSVRLLRCGVDFLKSGGEDPGVLLTLTSVERSILNQALGLEEGPQ